MPGATVVNERPRKLKFNELTLRKYMQRNLPGLVRLDTFSGRITLVRPIPRPGLEPEAAFRPRKWRDTDTTALIEHLIAERFDKVRRTTVQSVVELEAQTQPYSSAKERFEALPSWDGIERLDTFFADVLESEPTDWLRKVTRCTFIAICARVFEPGCKVDTVVVLESNQGVKKGQLLRVLSLDDAWFSDTMPVNLMSASARQHTMGKLIIEMTELEQVNRTGIEALKGFITTQWDKFRMPYGHFEIDWPRQCVFFGSTNSDSYLRDSQNRRFWPIKCQVINLDIARQQIEQAYAEALVAYRAKENWWLDETMEEEARMEQAIRRTVDPWEPLILEHLRTKENEAIGKEEVTFRVNAPALLWDVLKITIDKQDGRAMDRVGRILTMLGGSKVRAQESGKRVNYREFTIGNVGREA